MTDSQVDKRPQFGGRVLGHGEDVFKHNAWDNVMWDEEQEVEAEKLVRAAAALRVDENKAQDFEEKANVYWDQFYGVHLNRFFKDRNWLFTEFPELAPNYTAAPRRVFAGDSDEKDTADTAARENPDDSAKDSRKVSVPSDSVHLPLDNEGQKTGDDNTETEAFMSLQLDKTVSKLRSGESWVGENAKFRMLEVGCGTGSTVYPILEVNRDPFLFVYCCDLSPTAVSLVKEHKDYSGGRCASFVADVTGEWGGVAPFPPASLDIVTLIFVLSAIHPDRMTQVAASIFQYLKPGGQLFFRDYGRHDMAQLRFKPGKCIQDNFYVRGDGTRCYFFTQEEVRHIFLSAGFEEEQNIVDRRLQVNRGKKLKMYRVWVQAKFRKPC